MVVLDGRKVISADMNNEIEQETLSSGAVCLCKHPLNYKRNDTGGSKEIQRTNSTRNPDDGRSRRKATRKSQIKWTSSLENHFCEAIEHIGVHKVTPTKILKYMNLNYLTRTHVASKLQKYRKTRRAMISNIQSSSYINPQRSYNYKTSLSNNNLFNPQRGYGLGQSSHTMNNNAGFLGSVNYMNGRPTYSSQTGSNFCLGETALEEMGSMSRTSQESQAHKLGQYGTTSGVLGMDSNLNTGITDSNYAGIRIDEEGDLVNSTDNGNGSLDGVIIHGNSNANGSLGGMRDHGTGSGSLGVIQVHDTGNGNASLGENVSGMNWNFNNNNMSNHGSSTSRFPSALSSFLDNVDQSQNYLNAQTGGVAPVLENLRITNNHHSINEFSRDTVDSQFDHNQQQGNANGENSKAPTAYPLENLSNGNYNEETLNTVAANSEMYFPTAQNMNNTNQEYGVEDLKLPLSFDQDYDDDNFLKFLLEHDMN
ncbi:hypothetical protein Bca52824_009623 [Brassica carinata]|uniref:Myb-like domain-containing protein n=1 Tax=Brassica carinata TaxID=52824 RepID=A0A8X7WDI3_BRACI|nr:hypothetical protein Bca52824_009623 [Brassica carinata]